MFSQQNYEENIMNKRHSTSNLKNTRLMSWDEARDYCGLGRAAVREFGERTGAIKHYGRRVLFDRIIMDEKLSEGNELK